jgi:hypothetical protein
VTAAVEQIRIFILLLYQKRHWASISHAPRTNFQILPQSVLAVLNRKVFFSEDRPLRFASKTHEAVMLPWPTGLNRPKAVSHFATESSSFPVMGGLRALLRSEGTTKTAFSGLLRGPTWEWIGMRPRRVPSILNMNSLRSFAGFPDETHF